ncbi:helix-turn-helix domain-containing protein, partial [uncultured Microscilla sp.]|uniref:helix-turn-helix domain-containing protein n=1 Tax=uncultured Microscilla sp. TaxID=432653 RepID=UPI00262AD313
MEILEITKDTDIREYRRQLIVRLSKHELTQEEIADVVGCSQGLVSQTLQNYAADGLSGIASVPHSGPTPGLDSSDLATLEQLLSKGAS